jgi:uncharacterized protein (TIGR03083 family)
VDLWAVIAEERASILETFEALPPEQWDTPSLCGQWTVRQVLGHLVIAADPPTGRFLRELARAGGSFDKANARLAVAEAARPIEDLVARYGERIGARNTPPGFGPQAPLSDILLHSLDVRIPLGLPSDRPADHYAPALELLFSSRGQRIFVPKGRPPVRWVATDLAWTHGTGDEVKGTMADLALAASGRGARADALAGPGQPALWAWLRR